MKIANENSFTCSQFKKNLRAFIDNELPVNIKSLFLEHASVCPICNRALAEMRLLKKRLMNLERVSVTPEFDFRLKSMLRKENQKKRSSALTKTIFPLQDRSRILMVSAAAAVLITAFTFIYTAGNKNMQPAIPEVVQTHLDSYDGVEIVPESNGASIDEVNYVLETVKKSDVEKGIFQENPDKSETVLEKTENMILISY